MKLSVWAKKQGVTYRTAHKWVQTGKMPCEFTKMPSGTIVVYENADSKNSENVAVYARVSNAERRASLDGQIERCCQFALAKGYSVAKTYKEVASGMNDKRPQLIKMLDANHTHIIVENKDRLTRFGFNYLEYLLKKLGCEIIVLNADEENETDLIKDLVSIITSFCCRLYGMRRGQNKAKRIREELERE